MTRNRIDVHAHYLGGAAREWLLGFGDVPWTPSWSLDEAVAFMDERGIAAQILSQPAPLTDRGRAAGSARRAARAINEEYADIIRERPGRFGAFAAVPIDDPDDAVAEITYAIDDLGLDGVLLTSNANGAYFADEPFESVLGELDHRRIPAFVHPTDNPNFAGIERGRTWAICEYPFDTARTIIDAVYRGTFTRYPELKLILAHGGGVLPSLSWRIDALHGLRGPHDPKLPPSTIRATLAGLYYEIALAGGEPSLGPALQVTDPSHVLFGTDFPMAPPTALDDNIARFEALQERRGYDLAGVDRDNALGLFPRFASEQLE